MRLYNGGEERSERSAAGQPPVIGRTVVVVQFLFALPIRPVVVPIDGSALDPVALDERLAGQLARSVSLGQGFLPPEISIVPQRRATRLISSGAEEKNGTRDAVFWRGPVSARPDQTRHCGSSRPGRTQCRHQQGG